MVFSACNRASTTTVADGRSLFLPACPKVATNSGDTGDGNSAVMTAFYCEEPGLSLSRQEGDEAEPEEELELALVEDADRRDLRGAGESDSTC